MYLTCSCSRTQVSGSAQLSPLVEYVTRRVRPGSDARFRSGTCKWYKGGVEQLRVSVSGGDSYTVVALAGESDVYTYDQLRGALESEPRKGVPLLVVDLSELEFVDTPAGPSV